MKRLSLLGLALILPVSLHARTWVVDNDTTRPAEFRSAQAAHDAAAAGDTLLFVGSGQSYGDVTVSKAVHLLGPGFNFSENGIAAAELGTATFGAITLQFTTTDDGASGATLRGIFQNAAGITIQAGVHDILVDQCWTTSVVGEFDGGDTGTGRRATGIFIKRSSLGQASTTGGSITIFNSSLGYCLALSGGYFPEGFPNGVEVGGTITANQCVFTSPNNIAFGVSGDLPSRVTITNSIIRGAAPKGGFYDGVQISGSVLFRDAANYPGNRTVSNPDSALEVFIREPNAWNDEACYLLNDNPSNPAKGAGLGGVDAGMFAGADPYKLSVIPALPRVTHLSTSGVVSDTVGLTLNVGGEIRD